MAKARFCQLVEDFIEEVECTRYDIMADKFPLDAKPISQEVMQKWCNMMIDLKKMLYDWQAAYPSPHQIEINEMYTVDKLDWNSYGLTCVMVKLIELSDAVKRVVEGRYDASQCHLIMVGDYFQKLKPEVSNLFQETIS